MSNSGLSIVIIGGGFSGCRRIESSLLASLFVQGLAKPDVLALGLDVDADGALIGHDGHLSKNLFALGPVRKGCLWETTAVPEIRRQAGDLAEHIANRLAHIRVANRDYKRVRA